MKFIFLLLYIYSLQMTFMQKGNANDEITPPKQMNWSFNKPFGTFDRKALQRGFQVFQEACSTCHNLALLRYEKLKHLGFSKASIKAIAGEKEIKIIDDEGEFATRKATLGDYFVSSFANDNQARMANNGSLPPDLTLITKAKLNGANYLYSLLTGYEKIPKDITITEGLYYNKYFPGYKIAMAPPLSAGQVTYSDGTKSSVEQMAQDVTEFLSWTAEPESEYRRQLGIKVILYLLFFSILMYLLMRKTWSKVRDK